MVGSRPAPVRSTGELTWMVAEAIHRRCCGDGCAGAFSHLSEAAAALDAMRAQPRPEVTTVPPTAA